MKRIPLLISALLIACLCSRPMALGQDVFYQPALDAKDIDRTLGIDWYGVYLKTQKFGHCKLERARVGDTIVETQDMNLKITIDNKKSEARTAHTLIFEAKSPYRLLKATEIEADSDGTTKITAQRTAKGFDYVVTAAGKERSRVQPEPIFNLADNFAAELWLRSAPKVGDKMLARDLDIEDWKVYGNGHKIKSSKTTLVGGVEVKYYDVEIEDRKTGLSSLFRYDSAGKLLSGKIAVFELRKESEEQAKNTEFPQDLFVLGVVKIDRAIGFTTHLTELVLEVGGKEGAVLQNGPRQTVVAGKGDSRILKVGKKYANEFKADAKAIEENLAETSIYAVNDAKVKALAAKAVGDAKTPEEKVRRIVFFVNEFVIPTAMASRPNIVDLLEKKKGDCKSYALLTTTLCRAAGVPSREVAGLLYMGDDAKSFGGHAWNEVVLNGIWVQVDASLNEVELDAGHIFFGEDNRATGAMAQTMGKLSFKVIDSQVAK
jgi:hypothetical protein